MSPNEEINIEFRGGWQRLEQLYTQNQIYHYFNIKILNLLVGYFTCRGTIVILRYAHREAATGLTMVPQQVICSQAD